MEDQISSLNVELLLNMVIAWITYLINIFIRSNRTDFGNTRPLFFDMNNKAKPDQSKLQLIDMVGSSEMAREMESAIA